MIITTYGIIVFQLITRIAIATKSSEAVLRCFLDMSGFAYKAIPTRHEVCMKPYPQEDTIEIIFKYHMEKRTATLKP